MKRKLYKYNTDIEQELSNLAKRKSVLIFNYTLHHDTDTENKIYTLSSRMLELINRRGRNAITPTNEDVQISEAYNLNPQYTDDWYKEQKQRYKLILDRCDLLNILSR